MGSGRSKSWCWALLGVLLQFLVIIGGRPGLSAPFSPAVASSAARTPGLLLSFRPGAAANARLDALRRFGLQVDPAYRGKRVLRLRAAGGPGLSQLAKALRGHPAVRSAEPDYPLHATALPGDPRFAQLWGLHNTGQTGGLNDADIDALDAWELTTGSTSVTVAVLDSGVDYNHPDLRDNILRNSGGGVIGWDFANDDAEPLDDNGHGTHVAGTIGARGNNGIGVIGVSPTVRIMPVKFLHNDGNGSTSDAIEAIDFAVTHGARVLNCSWGGGAYSQFLLEAVRRARDAGVLVIAAAGNDGRNNDERPEFPAGYNRLSDNVLSIAALDDADRLAGFSNYGAASVDLSAPGVSILSTQPNDQYGYMSGTSMAAPHVSGTAALIWSRYPTLTVTQVRDRLLYNADEPLPVDRRVPARRLNAARALVEDTTSPGSPVALRLVAAAGTGLQFTWTSSGDDGGEGTASRYELYYAREPITRVENAASARGLPRPAPAGTPETFLLPSLAPTDQYYLALRAVDHVGNASPFEYLGPVRTLAPGARVEAFADDVERVPQFTGPKPWAVTTETSRSGSHCYADSPGALYATRVDTALTQGAGVSLVGFVPRLEFYARTDLEPGFDFVYVEVSADDGETWRRLDTSLTGQQDWLPESVPLGEFYGASIRIRFRLVTDEIVTGGGVWLDDIRITGERLIPTAAALPVPPTRLIATDIGQSDVSLAWQDNSNNEISFLVERRAGTGNFGIVAAVGAE
ncbi:MAG: peptidase, partial [Armatimonadetes bacterium]|nr:peptidase [Armatimonadota bacterium]